MKKLLLIIILCFYNVLLFSQDFVFPPELKWWLDEIQKVDESVSLDKFLFFEEKLILSDDDPLSYKNKLYPVFKKWNYYGNQFAYYPLRISLKKQKNGKYSVEPGDDVSEFCIFNKDETVDYVDFFGSSSRLDSFCWVKDNRITAVGSGSGKESDEYYFSIYDYFIKEGQCIRKEYVYVVKNPDLSKSKFRWWEQRSDYFISE